MTGPMTTGATMTAAFLRLVAGAERLGLWGASLSLVTLVALGLAEIGWRAISGGGLGFAVEYTGYLTGLAFTLGLGWAVGQGGHIRLPFLLARLPEPAARRLDIALSLMGAAIAVVAALGLVAWTWTSAVEGARSYFASRTLLAIPQAPFSLGVAGLALSLAGRAVRLATGRTATGRP
ncbi:hypothetical protein CCR80_04575 [Rhodothalassium salexigens]|nr:hypothetical protein [Rhodothalassium salexigens]